MKNKIIYVLTSAIITVMSVSSLAFSAFAEEQQAAGTGQASASGTASGGIFTFVIPLILMFVLLYFMAIRPQKKREQEAKDMQNSLQIGDEVITSGGIVGMIFRIGDDTVVIETGGERHKLRIKKWAIAENVSADERKKEAAAKTKTPLAAAGITDEKSKKKEKKQTEKSDDKKAEKSDDKKAE